MISYCSLLFTANHGIFCSRSARKLSEQLSFTLVLTRGSVNIVGCFCPCCLVMDVEQWISLCLRKYFNKNFFFPPCPITNIFYKGDARFIVQGFFPFRLSKSPDIGITRNIKQKKAVNELIRMIISPYSLHLTLKWINRIRWDDCHFIRSLLDSVKNVFRYFILHTNGPAQSHDHVSTDKNNTVFWL